MQHSNYALISALYANKNKGLYSDIYFPIIKYTLVKLFSKSQDSHPYCSADEVHDFIIERFGISIPHIVIAKSVTKINIQNNSNIELTIYENGNSFQIQRAFFDCNDEDIDKKEKLFSQELRIIEEQYQTFLEREGSINDNVTFIQFITDNTEEILGYFEEEDINKVDEKYATMMFFLQYLIEYNEHLYQVANQLFWSSIITGFLKSEKPYVDGEDNGIKNEYFLDTSIALGLLKLSTPQRETYSKDVCDIIKNSGGILRINPMTIDEITFILQSVEQNGPNPFTDIASAYERRKLDVNRLAEIRLNLVTIIENLGVNVFPIMSSAEKTKIIQTYRGKNSTRLLGEIRNKRIDSYSADCYREIHDLYMDDYIKERRRKKEGDKHVHFLTANKDLISFCKNLHPSDNYMISTSKILLELWMHNTNPIDISSCALTEAMARCLDMHNVRVRSKIIEVSRYYNKTKDCFNPEIYKDFIKKLYLRAKNVILTVETDPDALSNIGNELGELIAKAVDFDNSAYNKRTAEMEKENKVLQENIYLKNDEIGKQEIKIGTIIKEKLAVEKENLKLSNDKENLLLELEQKKESLAKEEEEKGKEIKAKEKAHETIRLYKRRDELISEIRKKGTEISPYEKKLQKSFHNWPFYVLISIVLILIIILAILWYICYKYGTQYIFLNDNKGIMSTIILTIVGFCLTATYHFSSESNVEKRKNKFYNKWKSKPENAKYTILKEELDCLSKELEQIECSLKKN